MQFYDPKDFMFEPTIFTSALCMKHCINLIQAFTFWNGTSQPVVLGGGYIFEGPLYSRIIVLTELHINILQCVHAFSHVLPTCCLVWTKQHSERVDSLPILLSIICILCSINGGISFTKPCTTTNHKTSADYIRIGWAAHPLIMVKYKGQDMIRWFTKYWFKHLSK